MAKLDRVWHNNSVRFTVRYRLCTPLILPITWLLCLLRQTDPRIWFQESNETAPNPSTQIQKFPTESGRHPCESPRKPYNGETAQAGLWFGHVARHVSQVVLQGSEEGGRARDRQRKTWMAKVKELTCRSRVAQVPVECQNKCLSSRTMDIRTGENGEGVGG